MLEIVVAVVSVVVIVVPDAIGMLATAMSVVDATGIAMLFIALAAETSVVVVVVVVEAVVEATTGVATGSVLLHDFNNAQASAPKINRPIIGSNIFIKPPSSRLGVATRCSSLRVVVWTVGVVAACAGDKFNIVKMPAGINAYAQAGITEATDAILFDKKVFSGVVPASERNSRSTSGAARLTKELVSCSGTL